MKKVFSIMILVFFTCICLTAQRARVVYAETLGSGVFWSLNYDIRFKPQPGGLGARLGGSAFENFLIVPLQLNYISGKKHGFEAGLGSTLFLNMDYQGVEGEAEIEFCPSVNLMYRYQGVKGLNVRLGLSPFFPLIGDDSFIYSPLFYLWPGASVGYRF